MSSDAGVDFGRFATALSVSRSARHPYDEVLLELSGCAVTPTLGSILPYWLLVIPRALALNFVEWRSLTGIEPQRIVADLLAECDIEGDRAIWFEHGASARASAIGCGTDHAHLHVIIDAPFSFDEFVSTARDAARVPWKAQEAVRAHRSIQRDASYLLVASANRALVATGVEVVGSQFFRRIVANLVGRPHEWDYNLHPHIANVRKTLLAFGDEVAQRVTR
jgi:ATP adenylyltransferase